MIEDAFHAGGWGMWPTLFCGVLMIAAAVWYAVFPERRYLPLLLSLAVMTMVSGFLGFTTGVTKSLVALGGVGPDQRFIYLIGLGESLYNVVWALVLVMLATIAVAIGALRLARTPVAPARSPEARGAAA
jgi:hypothetical protein